jgi:hypothetical protein
MTFAKKFRPVFRGFPERLSAGLAALGRWLFVNLPLQPQPQRLRRHFTGTDSCAIVTVINMDKFWSICCMPIGVLFCFGPVLVAWWLAERQNASSGKTADKS